MNKLLIPALACLCFCAQAAIVLPAPPPELSDTLKNYRTAEQQEENTVVDNPAAAGEREEIKTEEPPFVPGDDSAGVVRTAGVYTPEQAVGVPTNGAAIVRFFDLQGVPWDIREVRVETQGFLAETTASPSELLIKQQQGASTARMSVMLESYDVPLVFTLRPVSLEQGGVKVSTVLNTVRVRSYHNAEGYLIPEKAEIAVPHPNAETAKFDNVGMDRIEAVLTDAVRKLKADNGQDAQ